MLFRQYIFDSGETHITIIIRHETRHHATDNKYKILFIIIQSINIVFAM